MRCCRLLLAGALASAAFAAESRVQAQGALGPLEHLRFSQYQLKVDGLAADQIPQLFLGTASVAPDRGFPWMVSLGVKGVPPQLGHFCGGVLVENSWVLTAAHCISHPAGPGQGAETVKVEPEKVHVLTGSNVLFRGGQIKSVSRIVLHPAHRITAAGVVENDIAMLQLTEPVELTPIKIATVVQAAAFLTEGKKIRTLGWGTASFSPQGPLSNNLLYAFTTVVDTNRCNEPAVFDGAITDSMFCAGLGSAFACQGDSGGPAVGYTASEPYLVGLVSWGAGCGGERPTVYSRVVEQAGWIYETIGRSK